MPISADLPPEISNEYPRHTPVVVPATLRREGKPNNEETLLLDYEKSQRSIIFYDSRLEDSQRRQMEARNYLHFRKALQRHGLELSTQEEQFLIDRFRALSRFIVNQFHPNFIGVRLTPDRAVYIRANFTPDRYATFELWAPEEEEDTELIIHYKTPGSKQSFYGTYEETLNAFSRVETDLS